MKKIFFIVIIFILLFLVIGFFGRGSEPETDIQGTDFEIKEYRLENEGISFEYKNGPDGYIIEDLSSLTSEQPEGSEVIAVHRLINTKEKAELDNSEEGREGPPTINLVIFKNYKNQSASMWVNNFPTFSNINLAIGEVDRDYVAGGANAVYYKADGLYRNQNVVITNNGYIYYFSGSYHDEDSQIFEDFNNIINSIEFFPINENNISNAKIDPRVACESALIYMTFPSGEEANAFVEECVDGKHPEVIERYISDMGLDGATI